ncbi:MAG: type II toxin-antitoxin system RnlB family antitoxin [Oscillospiraceae bacterium]|nr:type II toxin-antitoxin system RnlB family antitoxin [Oscillospiraceae bacterium]
MKNYQIIKMENNQYRFLVIATSYVSPISTLDDVQSDIGNITGDVLFDLTLINGTNSNRYIQGKIERGIFQRKSFKTVRLIDPEAKSITVDFFRRNASVVDKGTITPALKHYLVYGDKVYDHKLKK